MGVHEVSLHPHVVGATGQTCHGRAAEGAIGVGALADDLGEEVLQVADLFDVVVQFGFRPAPLRRGYRCLNVRPPEA